MQVVDIAPEVLRNLLSPHTPLETSGGFSPPKSRPTSRPTGSRPDDRIRAKSARIFWSLHPETNRVVDVWVSTTDQPVALYTDEYFSDRWHCVVGNCDVDWLRHPEFTPEAVFGEMVGHGFHSRDEFINAVQQFAKIDSCTWALPMLGRFEVP